MQYQRIGTPECTISNVKSEEGELEGNVSGKAVRIKTMKMTNTDIGGKEALEGSKTIYICKFENQPS